MSSNALGRRIGISGQGVRKLEVAEAEGSISLRTLSKIADGLNCDVRYVLVPRTSLIEEVARRARKHEEDGIGVSPTANFAVWDAEALIAFSSVLDRLSRKEFW